MLDGHDAYQLFPHQYKACVIGAGGAIGAAFYQAFQADPLCVVVKAISQSLGDDFNLEDATSIQRQASRAKIEGPYNIIIDATGVLMMNDVGPEKSLAALNASHLLKAMHLNAVAPAIVIQQFAPLLASGASIYAKLSARVGSITDNKKGGWYGYRASKAALNMLLQTTAIELQRKNPELKVIALQPGTVRSKLSQPFTLSVTNLLEPSTSVAGMLTAMKNAAVKTGAHFIDYQGNTIEW
jgi:NAD(P)-dependent dehydrogenase (short-subunit alcohol dehydrogenase family)